MRARAIVIYYDCAGNRNAQRCRVSRLGRERRAATEVSGDEPRVVAVFLRPRRLNREPVQEYS